MNKQKNMEQKEKEKIIENRADPKEKSFKNVSNLPCRSTRKSESNAINKYNKSGSTISPQISQAIKYNDKLMLDPENMSNNKHISSSNQNQLDQNKNSNKNIHGKPFSAQVNINLLNNFSQVIPNHQQSQSYGAVSNGSSLGNSMLQSKKISKKKPQLIEEEKILDKYEQYEKFDKYTGNMINNNVLIQNSRINSSNNNFPVNGINNVRANMNIHQKINQQKHMINGMNNSSGNNQSYLLISGPLIFFKLLISKISDA